MHKNIAVLPGDGIGPEITHEAVKVLKKIAEKFNHTFTFTEGLIGAAAIDATGNPYPDETHELCINSDAILFGAIGDPRFDNDPTAKVRPEQGLLKMRKALGLYANVRPITAFKGAEVKSPLKPEIIQGVDFVVIRELIGGIYFGERGRSADGKSAYDTCSYSRDEIMRVSRWGFDLALKRRNKVTLVDKANVLETSRLWRETVQELAKEYPSVEVEMMFVDNASMQMIKRPTDFDVLLTENMFGDILSDEASVITGSVGMLPSASIGEKTSIFEPIHGSFPKAAGQNTANPLATILSAAMLLEYSFNMMAEGKAIRDAVKNALDKGYGTKDIVSENALSTSEMGDTIVSLLL